MLKIKKVNTPRGWCVVIQGPNENDFIEVFHNGYFDYGKDDSCSLKEVLYQASRGRLHSQQRFSDLTNEQSVVIEIAERKQHLEVLKAELAELKEKLIKMLKEVNSFEWSLRRFKSSEQLEQEALQHVSTRKK